MRHVLIVGAGGIGSWLAEHLFNLELHGQFPDDMVFTFADDDSAFVINFLFIVTLPACCPTA